MDNYKRMKDVVKNILLAEPFDTIEGYDEAWSAELFSIEPRKFGFESTQKIGAKNVLDAFNFICAVCEPIVEGYEEKVNEEQFVDATNDILKDIIDSLQKNKIIKYSPEFNRRSFTVVDGKRKENRDKTD